MSNEKFQRALSIVLLVVAIFSTIAFGLNQFSGYVDNLEAAKVRTAEAECVFFGAPHAVIDAEGAAWCYASFYGSDQMIPLEYLQKQQKDVLSGGSQ